ncbi:hypothetical protein ACFO4E_19105 [Nocardiopsis mangrovi]|uniref:Integrase n=1 Tax=Nocardiopsis mangrovi TaxID=1179818 RepID=A0ABV9DYR8_9ACTN
MTFLGMAPQLMNERMGHLDRAVPAQYAHVTPEMRRILTMRLSEVWDETLARRREMSTTSPVPLVQWLLDATSPAQSHSRSTPDSDRRRVVAIRGDVAS